MKVLILGETTRASVWYKRSGYRPFSQDGCPCVTPDTITQTVLFPDLFAKPLVAAFDQEHASSDGGAVLLKATERVYCLDKGFARCLADKRAPGKMRHTLADLIGQRIRAQPTHSCLRRAQSRGDGQAPSRRRQSGSVQ